MTKSKLGGKNLDYTSRSSLEDIRNSTQARLVQEVGADAEGWFVYWFVLHCFLSQLSYITQDNQLRRGTNHNGLDPPPSMTNEENALQAGPPSNLMKAFSKLWFVPFDA